MRVSGPPCNHSDSRVKRPAVDLRDMKSALGSGTECLNSGYPDLNFCRTFTCKERVSFFKMSKVERVSGVGEE